MVATSPSLLKSEIAELWGRVVWSLILCASLAVHSRCRYGFVIVFTRISVWLKEVCRDAWLTKGRL